MCRTTFCRSGEQRPVLLPRNPHRGRVGVAAVCEDKLCTVCSSQASASFGALHKSFRGTPFGHPKTKLLSHVFSSGAHVWSHHATPQIRAEKHEGLGPQVLTETDNYLVTCPLRYVRKGGRSKMVSTDIVCSLRMNRHGTANTKAGTWTPSVAQPRGNKQRHPVLQT